MFKTQQIQLTGNIPDELHDYLIYLCENASSLVNCVIYQIATTLYLNLALVQHGGNKQTIKSYEKLIAG